MAGGTSEAAQSWACRNMARHASGVGKMPFIYPWEEEEEVEVEVEGRRRKRWRWKRKRRRWPYLEGGDAGGGLALRHVADRVHSLADLGNNKIYF